MMLGVCLSNGSWRTCWQRVDGGGVLVFECMLCPRIRDVRVVRRCQMRLWLRPRSPLENVTCQFGDNASMALLGVFC